MIELKRCPVCGAKAFIRRDAPDGFYMGYSVGCPRFCSDDGIHGWKIGDSDDKRLTMFGFNSRKEAIEAWNKKVENWKN